MKKTWVCKDQVALLNSFILLVVGEQMNKTIEVNPNNFDMPDSKLAYTNPCRTYSKERNYS